MMMMMIMIMIIIIIIIKRTGLSPITNQIL